MPDSTSFESIFIGTSPVMMLEAAFQAKTGKRVLMIENSDQVGGAWKTFDMGEIKNVDYGCHIINPIEACYEFLNQYCSIEMEKMEPQPMSVYPGAKVSLPMGTRSVVIHRIKRRMFGLAKCLFKAEFRGAYIEILRLKSLFKNYISKLYSNVKPYQYPIHGAADMVQKIFQLTENSGVKIHLKEEVLSIHVEANNCYLKTGEKKYKTEKLFISSGTTFKELIIDKQQVPIKDVIRLFPHVFLEIEDKGPAKSEFTYLYVSEHPYVDRVHDVTKHVSHSQNTRKIMVALKPEMDVDDVDERIISEIKKMLEAFSYVSESSRIISQKKYAYSVNYMNETALDYYRKMSNGVIDFVLTTNIAASIGMYADRWKEGSI